MGLSFGGFQGSWKYKPRGHFLYEQEEARAMLAAEGLKTDYCRVRSLPLCQEVVDFIGAHDRTYVVEINRDGQLKQILTLEIPHLCTQLHQVSHIDGMPLSARWVKDQILDQEGR